MSIATDSRTTSLAQLSQAGRLRLWLTVNWQQFREAWSIFSRNRLAARLLDCLLPALQEFESGGMQPFMTDWQRHDLVSGRQIDLRLPNTVVRGTACGIDAGGALLVDTASGRRRFTSGEVSVRMIT